MQKIVITGGNFINKGAQSMLFCLVDELKRKFPLCEIVMIDLFPTLQGDKKDIYTFRVVNMHIRTLLRIAFPILKLIVKPKPISDPEDEIKNHFQSADIILDISGYGVSSHNQHPIWTYATIFPVKYAKKHHVPFVFLPQSIGPFDFKGWKKIVLWPLIKKYLQYPETIFIREPEARKHLEKLKTKQVVDSFDLVLQSNKIDATSIFKKPDEFIHKTTKVKNGSILLIPNKQLTRLMPKGEVVQLFSSVIQSLVQQNQTVVIVRHSADDKEICDLIYEACKCEQVQLVNEDLDPLQLQEIFDTSKMVVAARYHGLIHALKLCKPCLVVGWANKYNHVMNTFGLSDYYFDITTINLDKLNQAAQTMLNDLSAIENTIATQLSKIKSSDLFTFIK